MNNEQLSAKGLFIWGICAVFFLYEFFLRTVLGAYQGPIVQELNLTSLEFSLLSATVFSVIYGIMQIPVGIIVDNIGLKRSLLIGSMICMISCVGFSSSPNYHIAIAYRLLMGFGASFGFICLLICVNEWIPHRYNGLFIGLSLFIGILGPTTAAGPVNSISEYYSLSWRTVFLYLGFISGMLFLLILFFVENKKQKVKRYVILHRPQKISTSILKLFDRIQPWYLAIFSACVYFSIEYLSETEGRVFLASKSISMSSASYMLTTSWIGYAIGCPVLGLLSDIMERRKIVMQVSGFFGLMAILTIILSANKQYIQFAFIVLGFCGRQPKHYLCCYYRAI